MGSKPTFEAKPSRVSRFYRTLCGRPSRRPLSSTCCGHTTPAGFGEHIMPGDRRGRFARRVAASRGGVAQGGGLVRAGSARRPLPFPLQISRGRGRGGRNDSRGGPHRLARGRRAKAARKPRRRAARTSQDCLQDRPVSSVESAFHLRPCPSRKTVENTPEG